MEFSIKHISPLFRRGMIIPWILFAAMIAVYLIFGLNFTNMAALNVFIAVSAVLTAVWLVFAILYGIERLCGAKLIIESDHIEARMLLRRKRIRYDDISDSKYRHYEETRDEDDRKHIYSKSHATVRSRFDLYLSSGKVFSVNDIATGYKEKRLRIHTDPGIDPDSDVKLYQAYKYFRFAYNKYFYP